MENPKPPTGYKMFKFELGSEVKSDITGFKGVVTANCVHLNGCNRCYVQPKIDKEGKVPDAWWVDEPELKLVKKPNVKRDAAKKPGGFPSKIK